VSEPSNSPQPFNGPGGEASPAPKPWRPELSGLGGGQSGGAPTAKPWRPELQSGQPAVPAGDAALDATFAEPADQQGEQEFAPVAGGPGKLKASLSKANLVLFGLFLAGVAVVAFMSLKKGPHAVSAADQQAEKKVDTAIDKFLTTHGAEKPSPAQPANRPTSPESPDAKKLLSDTRRLVDLFLNFTSKKQVPLENLRVNPFKFDATAEAVQNNPKSIAEKKAEEEARKKRIEQAKANVKKLQLQTVISGPAGRQAMVNGAILKVNDRIEGFTVTDIQDRSVTLVYEGLTFTLEMGY
jgi:hypothetical protein